MNEKVLDKSHKNYYIGLFFRIQMMIRSFNLFKRERVMAIIRSIQIENRPTDQKIYMSYIIDIKGRLFYTSVSHI